MQAYMSVYRGQTSMYKVQVYNKETAGGLRTTKVRPRSFMTSTRDYPR